MIEIKAVRDAETNEKDLISRKSVIYAINLWIGCGEYNFTNATYYLKDRIKDLPSVNPSVSIQITEREKYGRFD